MELIIKIAQTKPKLAAILSLALPLSLVLFFLAERKTFTFGRSTEESEEKASKILWLLTKYLIKQKYVAAKSTQKANLQSERERKNIFCILTHAGEQHM